MRHADSSISNRFAKKSLYTVPRDMNESFRLQDEHWPLLGWAFLAIALSVRLVARNKRWNRTIALLAVSSVIYLSFRLGANLGLTVIGWAALIGMALDCFSEPSFKNASWQVKAVRSIPYLVCLANIVCFGSPGPERTITLSEGVLVDHKSPSLLQLDTVSIPKSDITSSLVTARTPKIEQWRFRSAGSKPTEIFIDPEDKFVDSHGVVWDGTGLARQIVDWSGKGYHEKTVLNLYPGS